MHIVCTPGKSSGGHGVTFIFLIVFFPDDWCSSWKKIVMTSSFNMFLSDSQMQILQLFELQWFVLHRYAEVTSTEQFRRENAICSGEIHSIESSKIIY